MEEIIEFDGQDHTLTSLGAMRGLELIDLHNKIAQGFPDVQAVAKFSDKTTAVRRIWALLNKHRESQLAQTQTTKAQRKKSFNFPFTGEIQRHREGTLRAKVVERLRRGVTYEQIVQEVRAFDLERGVPSKNVERRAYEVIRLVHSYLGYGLRQDADDRIFLVEEAADGSA